MQIKTTLRKHLTPLRIAIINKYDSKYRRPNQCWRGFTLSGGAAMVEISSKISQKVKNQTPLRSLYFTPGHIPSELHNPTIETQTPKFIDALFTI